MFGISIGKYEITKLRNREKAIMRELKNRSSTSLISSVKYTDNVFDFNAFKLQQELKLLRTKLKIIGDDDDSIA